MTKKDYVLIAGSIANTIKNLNSEAQKDGMKAISEIVTNLTVDLIQENENFNKEKFINFCYNIKN